jgi:hypothetical protein
MVFMKLGIRFFDGQTDWAWVQEQIGILRVEDTGGMVAFNEETGELLAACMWDNWTANSVQCHFMITTPMIFRHGFAEEVFDYIFNYKGRKFIYGMVPGDNENALKINEHIGFTEKMRLPDAWADGVDYVVVELKKENCLYLPNEAAA